MADGSEPSSAARVAETIAPAAPDARSRPTGPIPHAALALRLAARLSAGGEHLVMAADETRATALAQAVAALAPGAEVILLPRWDVPPGEAVAPSRAVMGRRVAALRRLARPATTGRMVVTTADAAVQMLPPADVMAAASFTLAVGEPFDEAALRRFLTRTGWAFDDRVDEPGEVAVRGQVIDVYPAGEAQPFRLDHDDGRVAGIHRFDPATQRTTSNGIETVTLAPASEAVLPEDAEPDEDSVPEARLGALYDRLDSLFGLMPAATVWTEPTVRRRAAALLAQADEDERTARLTVPRDEVERALSAVEPLAALGRAGPVPRFAARRDGIRAFRDHVAAALEAGDRVLIAGEEADVAALARRLGRTPERVETASAVLAAGPGSLLAATVDLGAGARLDDEAVTVIAAADVLGRRARRHRDERSAAEAVLIDAGFTVGDAVIHIDHGLGILRGLEAVAGDAGETVRLEYAGGAVLMVPVADMDRIWRYGADADAVTLDRLGGEAWPKRRAKVEAALAEAAERLTAAAEARSRETAPVIRPPEDRYDRFAARFGYTETADQARAIDDVLADLASGRPMNRLVCGDVGYGKTEVALRAAAAVAFSGRQVAIVAPTTVLARQHDSIVRDRFRGLGVTVGHLSRFARPAEAKAVKEGLKDGSTRVVVGTHAVAGKGVEIPDLGLLVIDEEQRFGAAQKAALRALGKGVHVLTLTATPIPRTLQSALAGLTDLSLVATPPALRRPIATRVLSWSDTVAAEALRAEARRRGQSFVVCPRIEDLEPMADRLAAIAPELSVRMLHAKLPADEIDRTLIEFGRGEGDVLLATSIVESGLDMPRVNTILVWHADRFGLAQLHQLRGRVGRGTRRGMALLTTDPDGELAPATLKRLETLVALDQLGAGFAISASDLDQRGAGDLFGEDQAGHVKLIGAGLYRRMLEVALRRAKGEAVDERPPPEIRGVDLGRIPPDWVPEPDVRLDLYAKAYGLSDAGAVDGFAEEIGDRFGAPPPPAAAFLDVLRLRVLAKAAKVSRIDLGPQAIAFTFEDAGTADGFAADLTGPGLSVPDVTVKEEKVVVGAALEAEPDRIRAATGWLDAGS
ncbi:helicase-related protein [Chthonobacter rhizosphaerae]|uniref:helicase-related protein n=1 Tax=Chthonobacter rhizosphaerae TaxID=2735553 RepID=UPI0015EF1B28|nr:helicase-related protein [Chthonobacter rhizosphaerae]